MVYRYGVAFFVAFLCCACNNTGTDPQADDEFREVKFFNRGETIVVPAPPGTLDSILGMAYDINLNDKDSNGVRHRMYPYTVSSSNERMYKSELTLLETRSELTANANVLFASGGVSRKQGMRYAVLKIESVSRVLSLQPQGSPLYSGRIFASKIYYGWTLNYVFEGDSTQLNEHIAVNLASLIARGGNLTNEVSRLQLRKYVVSRGLSPKNTNDVVVALDADDVKKNFTTSGSGNQPIAIEYECATDFSVPAVNVKAPKYLPGNFVIDSIAFSIAETQADGSSWDFGSDPDPIIRLYRNNGEEYAVQVDDRISGSVKIGRPLSLNAGDQINVVLWDEDNDENDFIGDFGIMANSIFEKYYVHDPLPLEPTSQHGQIKNVTLFIRPVR